MRHRQSIGDELSLDHEVDAYIEITSSSLASPRRPLVLAGASADSRIRANSVFQLGGSGVPRKRDASANRGPSQ